jgi:hypothetical protein
VLTTFRPYVSPAELRPTDGEKDSDKVGNNANEENVGVDEVDTSDAEAWAEAANIPPEWEEMSTDDDEESDASQEYDEGDEPGEQRRTEKMAFDDDEDSDEIQVRDKGDEAGRKRKKTEEQPGMQSYTQWRKPRWAEAKISNLESLAAGQVIAKQQAADRAAEEAKNAKTPSATFAVDEDDDGVPMDRNEYEEQDLDHHGEVDLEAAHVTPEAVDLLKQADLLGPSATMASLVHSCETAGLFACDFVVKKVSTQDIELYMPTKPEKFEGDNTRGRQELQKLKTAKQHELYTGETLKPDGDTKVDADDGDGVESQPGPEDDAGADVRDSDDDDANTYADLSQEDIVRQVRAKHQFEQPSDQRDGFMLFALHALANLRGESHPPLFLVIVGPAGTGKTKVVDAVRELYKRLGVSHWLRCAAMQGGIAHAIGGVTWHSLLGMGIAKAAQVNADTVDEVFDKARTVITDEFSLIPPQFLAKIAQGMGGDAGTPFRGHDMAWCGDVSQLPPVGGDTLYGKSADVVPPVVVEKPARQALSRAQQKAEEVKKAKAAAKAKTAAKLSMGRALWNPTHVVFLGKNWRQKDDQPHLAMCTRMREGIGTVLAPSPRRTTRS